MNGQTEHLIRLANPLAHAARWFALEDFSSLEALIQAVEARLICPFHIEGATTNSLKLIDSIGFRLEGDDDATNHLHPTTTLAQAWAMAIANEGATS